MTTAKSPSKGPHVSRRLMFPRKLTKLTKYVIITVPTKYSSLVGWMNEWMNEWMLVGSRTTNLWSLFSKSERRLRIKRETETTRVRRSGGSGDKTCSQWCENWRKLHRPIIDVPPFLFTLKVFPWVHKTYSNLFNVIQGHII